MAKLRVAMQAFFRNAAGDPVEPKLDGSDQLLVVDAATGAALASVIAKLDAVLSAQLPDGHAVTVASLQTDALTDTELRASSVATADDYGLGEVLADQSGADGVLTFTFASPVVSFWVAVIGDEGVAKVDHYGGTPSASAGIPVDAGGMVPVPEPATVVKVYAPTGVTVTVWGQRRA